MDLPQAKIAVGQIEEFCVNLPTVAKHKFSKNPLRGAKARRIPVYADAGLSRHPWMATLWGRIDEKIRICPRVSKLINLLLHSVGI